MWTEEDWESGVLFLTPAGFWWSFCNSGLFLYLCFIHFCCLNSFCKEIQSLREKASFTQTIFADLNFLLKQQIILYGLTALFFLIYLSCFVLFCFVFALKSSWEHFILIQFVFKLMNALAFCRAEQMFPATSMYNIWQPFHYSKFSCKRKLFNQKHGLR